MIGEWQPMKTVPRDGRHVLVAAKSGYVSTPLRVAVCHYEQGFGKGRPWKTHNGQSFCEDREYMVGWMPLPPIPDHVKQTITSFDKLIDQMDQKAYE